MSSVNLSVNPLFCLYVIFHSCYTYCIMNSDTEKRIINQNIALIESHTCTFIGIVKPPATTNMPWAHYIYKYKCPNDHISILEHHLLIKRKHICTTCYPNKHRKLEYFKTHTLPKILIEKKLKLIGVYKNALIPIAVECLKCQFQFSIRYSSLAYGRPVKTHCSKCRGFNLYPVSMIESVLQSNRWWWVKQNNKLHLSGRSKIQLICQQCNSKWPTKISTILNNNTLCPQGCNNNKIENIGIIYKISSPSGNVYIGQTIQKFKDRYRQYRQGYKSQKTAAYYTTISAAMRKYGFDNFKFEILHVDVPWNKLDQLEIEEIKKHNSYHHGYNETEGGKHSSENARLARERFDKHIRTQAMADARKRAREQHRRLTNFEKSLSKELKMFLKSVPSRDQEIKEMQLRVKRSVNAKKRAQKKLPKESKYVGVCKNKAKGKPWKANVKHKGKKFHLGVFGSEEEAAKAYDEAAKKYRGQTAKLNFP